MARSVEARPLPKPWCPVDPTYIGWGIVALALIAFCAFIYGTFSSTSLLNAHLSRAQTTMPFVAALAFGAAAAAFFLFGDAQQSRVVRWTKDMDCVVAILQPKDSDEGAVARLQRLQLLAETALATYGLPKPRQRAVTVTINDIHPVWWRASLGHWFPGLRSEGSSKRETQSIWLRSDKANPVALLHEASHLIIYDWHSKGFARILSDLVSEELAVPAESVDMMRRAAKVNAL